MAEYLVGDPMLRRDGSSVSSGDRALIPHKGSLNEAVELREHESSSLLLPQVNIGAGPRPSSQDDGVPQHLSLSSTELFFLFVCG